MPRESYSADTQWQHRSFDDQLAVTTDEQLKLARRSLIHYRKDVVRQTLRTSAAQARQKLHDQAARRFRRCDTTPSDVLLDRPLASQPGTWGVIAAFDAGITRAARLLNADSSVMSNTRYHRTTHDSRCPRGEGGSLARSAPPGRPHLRAAHVPQDCGQRCLR